MHLTFDFLQRKQALILFGGAVVSALLLGLSLVLVLSLIAAAEAAEAAEAEALVDCD